MTKYIIANWKMNLGLSESLKLANELKSFKKTSSELWLTASSVNIYPLCQELKGTDIEVGAQNVFYKDSGAYTGETSPGMLKEVGATYAVVGHSERRSLFKEHNSESTQRALGGLNSGLKVVYCIGETQEKRECEETNEILSEQLDGLLSNLESSLYDKLIIAYEPVWAIGTGLVASVEQIAITHKFIKDFSMAKTKHEFPILYGGSVKPENYGDIAKIENVSGALVGGASLDSDKLLKLVELSNNC
jgi:triosephosphate isomerase